MVKIGELTDSEYWNEKWKAFKVKKISERHFFYGKNGIFLRSIRRHNIKLNSKSILEVGGAGSYFLLALSKWGNSDVTAIDYSPVGLEKTREVFTLNDCLVKTIQSDFLSWDNEGKQYDILVHWGVLEHFENTVPIFTKCQQLLKPNGILVFAMPNMMAYGAYFWAKWAPDNWGKHIFHSDDTIKSACSLAGLKLDKVFYWGYPLLQISLWEKKGLLQTAVSLLNLSLIVLGAILPIYHFGHRKISVYRGFIASS
ncbi:class I SAM-dependent methyltransferase [Pelotomaculum propionicicum]|uniref:Ubiquinone biosynthesis O-methyltransferase n=1 Tax=Pelotomaculum propionicicum TaxID=258475 RepID=A0A4Y7RKJ7_9FIRM|nr:class I SAM-dependent methyltransferase [Pelotomaculum propionicicum]TEB09528.1 Ubiquinone biosynthesis O-methyltransferase [Pelotomaculum propionicicum]